MAKLWSNGVGGHRLLHASRNDLCKTVSALARVQYTRGTYKENTNEAVKSTTLLSEHIERVLVGSLARRLLVFNLFLIVNQSLAPETYFHQCVALS
jgi:hypothetical protein